MIPSGQSRRLFFFVPAGAERFDGSASDVVIQHVKRELEYVRTT